VPTPNGPVANMRRHLDRFGDIDDLSPDDLAFISGRSRDRILRAMAEGHLDFFARGRVRRIPVKAAQKFVEDLERTQPQPAAARPKSRQEAA
jgi:hypothetical protein